MSGDNQRELLSYLHSDLAQFAHGEKTNPWANVYDVAATQLLESSFKKFEEDSPAADAAAVEKFLTVNKAVGDWQWHSQGSWDDEVLGLVRNEIWNFLNPSGFYLDFSFQNLFDLGGVGAGASILGGGTDFYTKFFNSRLTVSSVELYHAYLNIILRLPCWRDAESIRFRQMGGFVVSEENRMSCVPKNRDISRTICAEPTLNMWFQLGMGRLIARRLRSYYGIDIERQQLINREMARRGSFDEGDSFSTIDLESASDCVSLSLIRLIFPKEVTDVLETLRVGYTILPNGERVKLNMLSTMGNGYTFPLQTLIFSSIVRAVYRQMGLPIVGNSECPEWSVYGDDIIVRRSAYRRIVSALTSFGFRVNGTKSFSEGPFRESCGSDFFKGQNVRGVYFKHLETRQDLFVAFNLLTEWSARTGISLPNTLRHLLKRSRFQPVPPWESSDAGHRVPEWYPRRKKFNRWGSECYIASVPRPTRLRFPHDVENRVVLRSGQLAWVNNPGLAVAVLSGVFRGGAILSQQRRVRYTSKRLVALNWDVPPRRWAQPLSNQPWLEMLNKMRDDCIAQSAYGTRWNTVFASLM